FIWSSGHDSLHSKPVTFYKTGRMVSNPCPQSLHFQSIENFNYLCPNINLAPTLNNLSSLFKVFEIQLLKSSMQAIFFIFFDRSTTNNFSVTYKQYLICNFFCNMKVMS